MACAQGAAMVELDVRRSASGTLVVHHDPVSNGRVIRCSADEELAAWVPTLDDALDACEGIEVNIEIKNDDTEPDFDASRSIAADVVSLLGRRGDGHRMLISSFDRATINRVRDLAPLLRTGYLFVVPELPLESFLSGIAEEGHVAIHPHRFAATRELCAASHEVGLAVNVWTVDAPDEMQRLASNGVDAIITNVPDVGVATFLEHQT